MAAIQAAADVSGGWGGQMIAQSGTEFSRQIFANVDTEAVRTYVAAGAADPSQTPRLTMALHGPLMKVVSDRDYISQATKSKYPIYRT